MRDRGFSWHCFEVPAYHGASFWRDFALMLGNENSDAGQFKCSLRPHLARGFPTPALTQQKPFAIWSFKHWRLKRFYFLRSYSGSFSFTSVLYQQTTSFCLQLKSVVIFWKKLTGASTCLRDGYPSKMFRLVACVALTCPRWLSWKIAI